MGEDEAFVTGRAGALASVAVAVVPFFVCAGALGACGGKTADTTAPDASADVPIQTDGSLVEASTSDQEVGDSGVRWLSKLTWDVGFSHALNRLVVLEGNAMQMRSPRSVCPM